MPNWTLLKSAIAEVIKTNDNQEITGQALQNVLNSVVNSIGENATFAGVATPTTNPGVPDGPVFYLAATPGDYVNFGLFVLQNNSLAVIDNSQGSWQMRVVFNYASQFKLLNEKINSIKPVIYEGSTINNAPDEEDITSENGLLKLKDRTGLNEMGYIILRKGKSFKEQLIQSNTIYEIRYDFDLAGEDVEVEIPEKCVLKFVGGSVSNGTLNGADCDIQAGLYNIFKNIDITGTWRCTDVFCEWFGAKGDGIGDDTYCIQKAIDSFNRVTLLKEYRITSIKTSERTKITNKGIVKSYGDGIVLENETIISGGTFIVNDNSTAITIGDTSKSHRRVTVKDMVILGTKDTETYGIKCVAGEKFYNTFCNIEGVFIYKCYHGFVGNIRTSRICLSLEQCHNNLNIEGDKNNIDIVGQASAYIEKYPYFITIKGSHNIIRENVYDIGYDNYQPYLISYEGSNNRLFSPLLNSYDSQKIDRSIFGNSISSMYALYGDLSHPVNVPKYSLEFDNCTSNVDIHSDYDIFNYNRQYHINITPIDSSKEFSLTINLGAVKFPYSFRTYYYTSSFSFSRMEIYDGDELLYSLNHTGSYSNFDWYNDYDSFLRTYTNLRVKLYATKQVRFLGCKLYAGVAPTIPIRGVKANRPTKEIYGAQLKVGFQYYDTTLNKPIWWNGSDWQDASGTLLQVEL